MTVLRFDGNARGPVASWRALLAQHLGKVGACTVHAAKLADYGFALHTPHWSADFGAIRCRSLSRHYQANQQHHDRAGGGRREYDDHDWLTRHQWFLEAMHKMLNDEPAVRLDD